MTVAQKERLNELEIKFPKLDNRWTNWIQHTENAPNKDLYPTSDGSYWKWCPVTLETEVQIINSDDGELYSGVARQLIWHRPALAKIPFDYYRKKENRNPVTRKPEKEKNLIDELTYWEKETANNETVTLTEE